MWFTVYWLDGSINYIFGATIEEAFTQAGYGNGSLKAVDWYNTGVEQTHWYNKENKEWFPFDEIRIHVSDVKGMEPNDIIKLLERHNTIIIELKGDDQLIFEHTWGKFHLNNIQKSAWVKYISVAFAEYSKGTYAGDSDDEENEHHYMMANGQYFSPADVAKAAQVFLKRALDDPFKAQPGSESMEDIHAKQKIAYTV